MTIGSSTPAYSRNSTHATALTLLIALLSTNNTLLLRYNVEWLDPTCEDVDALHLQESKIKHVRIITNSATLFDYLYPFNLVWKLRQSGVAATVTVSRWRRKVWHHTRTEIAGNHLFDSPRGNLFRS
jgi:hypothetical protein